MQTNILCKKIYYTRIFLCLAITFQNFNDGTGNLSKKIEYSIRLLHSTANLYTRQRSWMTKYIYPFFLNPGPRTET